jgi:hypothetical protein
MSSTWLYDTIGATYSTTRRTEPRIAAQVWAALGDARTALNVGAGTGSYEPSDRDVTAVEPSAVMRAQRPAGAAPCVDASASKLHGRGRLSIRETASDLGSGVGVAGERGFAQRSCNPDGMTSMPRYEAQHRQRDRLKANRAQGHLTLASIGTNPRNQGLLATDR